MSYKLNYRLMGEGDKSLVFVHGILGYWRNFYSISQTFREDYTCLLYDQRGHGLSFHKEPYTVEELAKDLKELLDFLNLKSVILTGHSLGGWVCSYLAHKEPELIEKLIVIDSSPWPKAEVAHDIKKILNYLPESFVEPENAREFFKTAVKEQVFSQQLAGFLMASLEKKSTGPIGFVFDKKGFLNLLSAVRQLPAPSIIKSLKVPTLFLRGERSLHFSKEDLENTVKLNPLIKGLEIKDSGHWLHAEQPQEFIKAVKAFLKA